MPESISPRVCSKSGHKPKDKPLFFYKENFSWEICRMSYSLSCQIGKIRTHTCVYIHTHTLCWTMFARSAGNLMKRSQGHLSQKWLEGFPSAPVRVGSSPICMFSGTRPIFISWPLCNSSEDSTTAEREEHLLRWLQISTTFSVNILHMQ